MPPVSAGRGPKQQESKIVTGRGGDAEFNVPPFVG
jgi:hypothetical protein